MDTTTTATAIIPASEIAVLGGTAYERYAIDARARINRALTENAEDLAHGKRLRWSCAAGRFNDRLRGDMTAELRAAGYAVTEDGSSGLMISLPQLTDPGKDVPGHGRRSGPEWPDAGESETP